jgi:hypothetical protein
MVDSAKILNRISCFSMLSLLFLQNMAEGLIVKVKRAMRFGG